MHYILSYYPIISTAKGREAVRQHSLPPYIDGSCRREPDLEHATPAITGLCRPGFSNLLTVGDTAIYVTNKGGLDSRFLVAILEVTHKCENHQTAAEWYRTEGLSLPNNILVPDNEPLSLELTHRLMGWGPSKERCQTVECWDKQYQHRAKDIKSSEVAICKPLKVDLHNPSEITDTEFLMVFGLKKGSPNYIKRTTEQWKKILNWSRK